MIIVIMVTKLSAMQLAICRDLLGDAMWHVHPRRKGDQLGTELPLFFVLDIYSSMHVPLHLCFLILH